MSQSSSTGFGDNRSCLEIEMKPDKPNLTMKEHEEKLSFLTKENFNLKLRVNHLQEIVRSAGQLSGQTGDEDSGKKILELNLEIAGLKKDLVEKQKLLIQADKAITLLETTIKDQIITFIGNQQIKYLIEKENVQDQYELNDCHGESNRSSLLDDNLQRHKLQPRSDTSSLHTNNIVLTHKVTHLCGETCRSDKDKQSEDMTTSVTCHRHKLSFANKHERDYYWKLRNENLKAHSAIHVLISKIKSLITENINLKEGHNLVNESADETSTQFYKREVSFSESSWKVSEFQTDISETPGEGSFNQQGNEFWWSVITDLIKKTPRDSVH